MNQVTPPFGDRSNRIATTEFVERAVRAGTHPRPPGPAEEHGHFRFLTVTDDALIERDLRVHGTSFLDNLRVGDRADFEDSVFIEDQLRVDGRSRFYDTVNIDADWALITEGRVSLEGGFGSSFWCEPHASFYRGVGIDGNLNVDGNVLFDNQFRVYGRSYFYGDVFLGDVNLRVDGSISLEQTLTAERNVYLNTDYGNTYISGIAYVSGLRVDDRPSRFDTNVYFDARTDFGNRAYFEFGLTVESTGSAIFWGSSIFEGTANFRNDVSFDGELNIYGALKVPTFIPSFPVAGFMYFNAAQSRLYVYTGTSWHHVTLIL
jgi:hypothetical protein